MTRLRADIEITVIDLGRRPFHGVEPHVIVERAPRTREEIDSLPWARQVHMAHAAIDYDLRELAWKQIEEPWASARSILDWLLRVLTRLQRQIDVSWSILIVGTDEKVLRWGVPQ